MSATRCRISLDTSLCPRSINGTASMKAPRQITATGPTLIRKVGKSMSACVAMRMFGGSPISVAVPPMFEASASAISSGAARTSSVRATTSVTGASSTTVVTLSRKAEATAVMAQRINSTRTGLPRATFTVRIASHWKTPVLASVFAIIIMPASRKITSSEMASKARSVVSTLKPIIAMPPASAAVVLCTRSKTISI